MSKRHFLLALAPLLVFGEECIDSCVCCDGPCSGFLAVRHREPEGIGFDKGYSSVDLFYSFNVAQEWYSFVDARGHVFNDGKWAANAGLGARYYPDCLDCTIFGLNLYWDGRQARHGTFHQIGAGLEALWPRLDLRLNGYGPVNRRKKIYKTGFAGFHGNTARFFQKSELSMWGFDFAAGYWLINCDPYKFHSALGAYTFHGKHSKHTTGGLFRAKLKLFDQIKIEGQVSYDHLFKWRGSGELSLSIPIGPSVKRYSRPTHCCPIIYQMEERIAEQPERFEIIVTTTEKKTTEALHPVTGEPLKFLFVDNTSGSAGTFEDPFASIADAVAASKAGDALYIFPGQASYTPTVTLKNNQLFAGSAAAVPVQTAFGPQVIPAQTAHQPIVGGMVTPANGNIYSGTFFKGTSLIIITGTNIKDFYAHDCTMVSKENRTAAFIDSSGLILFENNVLNAQLEGILFNRHLGNIVFRNNSITSITREGILSSEQVGRFTASDNSINGLTHGINLSTFDGVADITGNAILSQMEEVIITP